MIWSVTAKTPTASTLIYIVNKVVYSALILSLFAKYRSLHAVVVYMAV
jgi:hypothetical protein